MSKTAAHTQSIGGLTVKVKANHRDRDRRRPPRFGASVETSKDKAATANLPGEYPMGRRHRRDHPLTSIWPPPTHGSSRAALVRRLVSGVWLAVFRMVAPVEPAWCMGQPRRPLSGWLSVLDQHPNHRPTFVRGHHVMLGDWGGGCRLASHLPDATFRALLAGPSGASQWETIHRLSPFRGMDEALWDCPGRSLNVHFLMASSRKALCWVGQHLNSLSSAAKAFAAPWRFHFYGYTVPESSSPPPNFN